MNGIDNSSAPVASAPAAAALRVAIDAVGIRHSGGATVLEAFLASFPEIRPAWQVVTFLLPEARRDFRVPVGSGSFRTLVSECGNSWLGRLVWQNISLPLRLRQIKADVVFSIANSGAVWPSTPQVVYLHQLNAFRAALPHAKGSANRLRFWAIGLLANWSGKRSHAIIVQTESMKAAVTTRYPALADRLIVIPSGIRETQSSPTSQAWVQQLVGEGSGPVVSFVSTLSPHKNHSALLEAWPLVRAKHPAARLALTLGRGLGARSSSRRAGASSGWSSFDELPAGVLDLGILSQPEVRSLYLASTLMVFPSLMESFGLPLVEAMAAGCPVAASDLPWAREILSGAGVYFDPYSPPSIAAAVIDLLDDDRRRAQLIQLGAERVKDYRAEVMAERVAQVLEAAATSDRGPKQSLLRPGRANRRGLV